MIVIIDYGAGNLFSLSKALVKVSSSEIVVANSKKDIKKATRLVLPGVGAFSHCKNNLQKSGLLEILEDEVLSNKKPLLAICIGLQLMATVSYEYGINKGLGWLDDQVLPFEKNIADSNLKIPHTGWNRIFYTKQSKMFDGIENGSSFYFNHSYYMHYDNTAEYIAARCTYGIDFTAAIQKENIFGCQFHPEKSQNNGLCLLNNFTKWNP